MFKVLVIAYYYPPMGLSGVQRTLKFTKYMPQFNWEPTVITTGKTGYFAHDLTLLDEAKKAGVIIKRTEAFDPQSLLKRKGTMKMPPEIVRKTLSRISKTLFIPDNKKFWSLKAYNFAASILKQEHFDVIFVSGPPFSAFISAAKLRERFNIPLIIDYRDPWTGNQFSFNPTPYHAWKHKKLEDKVLRKADKVIVVNRLIKENLLKKFPFLTFNDVLILPHGFDPEDYESVVPVPDEKKKCKILYSGMFYENITPKYLLYAFKELSVERPDIAANIELQFAGHFRRENQKLVARLGLQHFVREFGYLNHRETVRRIMSANVLWVMLGKRKMEAVTPGKLFEYFGSGKPVLATVPDGVAKIAAQRYGASFITPPDDVKAIKNTLIEIDKRFRADKLPRPDEKFIAEYNRIDLTEKLTKEFQFYLRAEL